MLKDEVDKIFLKKKIKKLFESIRLNRKTCNLGYEIGITT